MALLSSTAGKGVYIVMCPGCKVEHVIHTKETERAGPKWDFNGDFEHPTFGPSILVRYTLGKENVEVVCHSYIRNGMWEFLSDCTHNLAGQVVPMIDSETEF